MTLAVAVAVDRVIRYRSGPSSTPAGLVVTISERRVLIEENYRFITPVRKWIDSDDIVEVLKEIPFTG